MTPRKAGSEEPPAPPPSLGPCEFPKCPDPKCERDTTVHCVHDKSEHLWPHTVPPDSKSARAAKEGEVPTGRRDQHPPSESRADKPPAPPPCAACVTGTIGGSVCRTDLPTYNALIRSIQAHHAHLAAKDAEIAELRAAIFHVTTWLEKGQIMYSPNFFILEFHHLLHSRAALAPKGGK